MDFNFRAPSPMFKEMRGLESPLFFDDFKVDVNISPSRFFTTTPPLWSPTKSLQECSPIKSILSNDSPTLKNFSENCFVDNIQLQPNGLIPFKPQVVKLEETNTLFSNESVNEEVIRPQVNHVIKLEAKGGAFEKFNDPIKNESSTSSFENNSSNNNTTVNNNNNNNENNSNNNIQQNTSFAKFKNFQQNNDNINLNTNINNPSNNNNNNNNNNDTNINQQQHTIQMGNAFSKFVNYPPNFTNNTSNNINNNNNNNNNNNPNFNMPNGNNNPFPKFENNPNNSNNSPNINKNIQNNNNINNNNFYPNNPFVNNNNNFNPSVQNNNNNFNNNNNTNVVRQQQQGVNPFPNMPLFNQSLMGGNSFKRFENTMNNNLVFNNMNNNMMNNNMNPNNNMNMNTNNNVNNMNMNLNNNMNMNNNMNNFNKTFQNQNSPFIKFESVTSFNNMNNVPENLNFNPQFVNNNNNNNNNNNPQSQNRKKNQLPNNEPKSNKKQKNKKEPENKSSNNKAIKPKFTTELTPTTLETIHKKRTQELQSPTFTDDGHLKSRVKEKKEVPDKIQCLGSSKKKGTQCKNAALLEYIGPRPLYCAEHIEEDKNTLHGKCKCTFFKEKGDGKPCKQIILKELVMCFRHFDEVLPTLTLDKARRQKNLVVEMIKKLRQDSKTFLKTNIDLYQRKSKLLPKYIKLDNILSKFISEKEKEENENMI